jgi:hypothetical protein
MSVIHAQRSATNVDFGRQVVIARCAVLDYFDSPAQRKLEKIFTWDANWPLLPGRPLIKWLRMIAREIALPTATPYELLCDDFPESSVLMLPRTALCLRSRSRNPFTH